MPQETKRAPRRTRPFAGRLTPSGFALSDKEFDLFRSLIHDKAGISLADHKRGLVVSRLAKRLRSLGLASFKDYYCYLTEGETGETEMVQMINRMTTNKTDFYRESYHFKYLEEELLPALARKGEGKGARRLRVWSAASSTGEEPYTIAITLAKFFANMPGWDIKLLATDLDTEVLTFASQGIYPAERVAPVPKHLRNKYFNKVGGGEPVSYQVSPQLRRMVTFRRFNLLAPTFPLKILLDFIFCRNVMIYFNNKDKIELLHKFHAVLKPGGYIFVGHSESLMMAKDIFRYVKHMIYQKI
ncbi:MAG: protein-glutamate O-methyltransferase CheR [Deltaproteobacteria bacterium]|nr:protein-glutamate O-methyltransferase CheR [Deltaproteobacteria bacterium]